MIDTEEEQLETIISPARLLTGTVVVRVLRCCEEIREYWQVVKWETPPKPKPGDSWSSGFLHLLGAEKGNRGQSLRVGPRRVILAEFRKIAEPKKVRARPEAEYQPMPAARREESGREAGYRQRQQRPPRNRGYWWEDRD